jgi:GMP synthase-like glutamine amidotransferase
MEKIDVTSFNGIIILGGMVSVRDIDTHNHLQNVMKVIEEADINEIPVLGICLGCQLIGKYCGSEIIKLNSPVCGFKDIDAKLNCNDEITKCIRNNNKMFISLHQDVIIPSKELKVLATSNGHPYYIKHNTLTGVQFHPDIVEANFCKFVKCFGKDFEKHPHIKEYYEKHKERITDASMQILSIWLKSI